ncbi:Hsp70 family protein [Dasania sp. GY-MA-18]|uniref:Hsp70 family protein n=1 Tax=Dasania phycosphaerae TaxID=2950436 RepID=A0A9J6RNB1_9GAMM|nr:MULTISPECIES: Hsp70 family protein [Dasania]MCR8923207.1 Hsp70 family protein [Dasania sp. GY-MA-18]MCZ0865639.1 Hsp70 family protein [Dasania phycosphaerae]MCZ0869364.1 Hsp70 family protein [Dasania phycosphaerae]
MKGIGIDFGTSNSAVAVYDGKQVQMIAVEANAQTVPTAIHLDRSFQALTGSVAIQTYVEENSDRRVEITAKVIAEVDTDLSGGTDGEASAPLKIYGAAEDHGLPGRLFLGIKRLLGKESIRRLMVFDKPYRLVALITPILLTFRNAISASAGPIAKGIYMGRPVEFEGSDTGKNALATDRIQEASGYAQLGQVTFYPEPVAACLSFVQANNIKDGSTILTVDFGGGTLDLCLVNYQDNDFQVLGTEGVALGGDYIDQLIFKKLIFPELGKGVLWTRMVDGKLVSTPFPFDQYEKALLNWTITHTLNQNQHTATIAEYLAQNTAEKEKLQRLQEVIRHNYSYSIFQHIKAAKIALSDVESTVLEIPELQLSIALNRQQFNNIIAEVIEELQHCIDKLLANTQIDANSLNYVVRTGGSSHIAAVLQLLEREFPNKVVQHDSFTSVASGLAIASYYGYTCKL